MLFETKKPKEYDKKLIKDEIDLLQNRLSVLQQALKERKIPTIILIDGWSASGKGRMMSALNAELEPRDYSVFSSTTPEIGELRRPFLWRFWRDIPPKGKMGIFERGWYREVIDCFDDNSRRAADMIESIEVFERQLARDGYLVLKYFLHMDKKAQKERLDRLKDNETTSWRVNSSDFEQNEQYDKRFDTRSRLMAATNYQYAPWTVINNEDRTLGTHSFLTSVCESIEHALEHGLPPAPPPGTMFSKAQVPNPSTIIMPPAMEQKKYKESLKKLREEIHELHSRIYRKKIPVVMCFEGWDAAGKGGSIRRLSSALDPRGFDLHAIAAPTSEEISRHYLWRFFTRLPKTGHMAIFDRTWYGRVMVERVEKLTDPARWNDGYDEINEFERELVRWGAVVLKFWLQIDQQTQLARFVDRQETPEKQHKITDEDWRNRAKWGEYEQALLDMLEHTSTEQAPWTIIEANDKKFARIKVLKTVKEALEKALEE